MAIPEYDRSDIAGLYVHLTGTATLSGAAGSAPMVTLGAGGQASFNTYFGALGTGKWQRLTFVESVEALVTVQGHCRVEVVHQCLGGPPTTVAAQEVEVETLTEVTLALPPLADLDGGCAHVVVLGLAPGATVAGGHWQTDAEPAHPVRLGLVITTFNRQDYVTASVARLVELIAANGRSDLQVIVVDNGRNLDLGDTHQTVTVLPNPNVGGAGGFARGLMHLRRQGWATHVLFMDDDVTFDATIVARAIALLSLARNPRLCISGAMLNDADPTVIFEAGARFDATATHPLTALGGGLDLLDWSDVLAADASDAPGPAARVDRSRGAASAPKAAGSRNPAIAYGAWWFFAFPIGLTRDNPLPVFVRGDDVAWGLMHAGDDIVTSLGIGLWHQDFDAKNGPLAWFYDTRNFALVSILVCEQFRWWHLLARYLTLCARSLLSFKYDSATEITFAMTEFLRGPEHWLALDHAELHDRVRALDGEKVIPLDDRLKAVPDARPRSGIAKVVGAAASLATLSGHLLPTSWCRRPIVALHVSHKALLAAPLRTELLFRAQRRGEGFVARRDQRRFFCELIKMLRTSLTIVRRFAVVARQYRNARPRMVSDEYWRRQFTGFDNDPD